MYSEDESENGAQSMLSNFTIVLVLPSNPTASTEHYARESCLGNHLPYDDRVLSEDDIPPDAIEELELDVNVEEQPPAGLPEPENDELHRRMVGLLEQYSLLAQGEQACSGTHDEDAMGWARAACKRLTSNDPESQFVADYAYDHLLNYRHNVQSLKVANEILRLNATRQHPSFGPPDPAGFTNCWPPSIACCEAILKKVMLDILLIHCCPNGCEHWWTNMPEFRQHFRECKGCKLCRCPHCGAERFANDKKGLRGSARCWLFFDAFQNMMLDAQLAAAVFRGRAARNDDTVSDDDPSKPSLAKSKEGKRLNDVLPELGYDLQKVLLSSQVVTLSSRTIVMLQMLPTYCEWRHGAGTTLRCSF
jgi:hypothetical protein